MSRNASPTTQKCLLFEECGQVSRARGFCRVHYDEARRGGRLSVSRQAPRGVSLLERLEFYGWEVTESGCWEWSGYAGASGYGQIWHGGRTLTVSRCAYEVWVGPIPDGTSVCHTCDNPPCINPEHLWLGTPADNARDKVAKGRDNNPFGEHHYGSKSTTDQVTEMRRRRAGGEILRTIATDMNVSLSTVSKICTGRNRARG